MKNGNRQPLGCLFSIIYATPPRPLQPGAGFLCAFSRHVALLTAPLRSARGGRPGGGVGGGGGL